MHGLAEFRAPAIRELVSSPAVCHVEFQQKKTEGIEKWVLSFFLLSPIWLQTL
jgi:hypothetical protein